MLTEIIVATATALSIARGPIERCGAIAGWGHLTASLDAEALAELPVTGTEQQLECAEQAVALGDGSDPIPPPLCDFWVGQFPHSTCRRWRKPEEPKLKLAAATWTPVPQPDWFIRCWSDGLHGNEIDSGWGKRDCREYFVWGLACDATYCYGLSHDNFDATLPMLTQFRFERAKCQPIIVTEVVPGGPQPPRGYPVRLVLP